MTLIGLTGTHGAGKGTITDYLKREHGFACFSVSEFLAVEAIRRGLTPDRHARHDIANEYRSKGPTALMEAVYDSVDSSLPRVILEPQYTVDEVRFIQGKGGVVFAVDASLETRYARVHVRGSAKDDVSFEEFKVAQEREMEAKDGVSQNLSAAIGAADVHLTNDGTVDELECAVSQALRLLVHW